MQTRLLENDFQACTQAFGRFAWKFYCLLAWGQLYKKVIKVNYAWLNANVIQ